MTLLSWLVASLLFGLARAEQGVVVRGPLDFEPLRSIAQLAPERKSSAEAIWAWSPLRPPHRYSPEGFARRGGPAGELGRPLRLRIPAAREPWAIGLRLIAAPVEMWEEVPEALLPAWPVPSTGRLEIPVDAARPWRLRVAGAEAGSFWLELPAGSTSAFLAVVRAPGASSRLVASGGRPVAGSSVRVLESDLGRLGQGKSWTWLLGDSQGRFHLSGLPDRSDLSWLATAEGHPPKLITSIPSRLPQEIELGVGASVVGRVVGPDGRPMKGARVVVETWSSTEAPISYRVQEETDSRGLFAARAVPPGKAVLVVSRKGWAVTRLPLEVPVEGLDTGIVTLSRGGSLAVHAVDDLGQPVAGAEIRTGLGQRGETDRAGRVRLEALPLDEPLRLQGSAAGHLSAEESVVLPVGEPVELHLGRAFQLTGRFASASGAPVGGATVRVIRGRSFEMESLEADGSFSLSLPPETSYVLRFTSPQSSALEVAVEAGAPGESRDLGELRAPAGGSIAGRLVNGATGEPVSGGRVWTPRPSAQGPLLAWMGRDLLETATGPDGQFRLSGLPPGPTTLRVEAAGFARQRRTVDVQTEGEASLGDLPLASGAALMVRAGPKGEGAMATVAPGFDGLPFDRLQAPVRDGEARIEAVPAGSARVSVTRSAALLCERVVQVPVDAVELSVECPAEGVTVRGTVTLGPRLAGAGALVWQTEAGPIPEGIMTYRSPTGLVQQQVYSANALPVTVPVDARGAFATTELRAGVWDVTYQPEGGGSTEPLKLALEGAKDQAVALRFPGYSAAGTVLDEEGRPVEDARVRDLEGGASTHSDSDGAFRLDGLRAKTYYLGASKDEAESEPLAVTIGDGEPQEPLVLTLRTGTRKPEVAVRVFSMDGTPAGGTFVFVELPGRGARVLMADQDGFAQLRLDPPFPATLRATARIGEVWVLGPWVVFEEAQKGLALGPSAPGIAGALQVEAGSTHGLLQIVAPGAWNLTALLSTLGSPPLLEPGSTLHLLGLPPGVYELKAGEQTRTVSVREGAAEAVTFERD